MAAPKDSICQGGYSSILSGGDLGWLDGVKNVSQTCGADASGRAVLRKKLRRDQVLAFFGKLASCLVATQACGGAYSFSRKIGKLGNDLRFILPAYVMRQENDAAQAEAVCKAPMRPTVRFVPARVPWSGDGFRGRLGEFGKIVPQRGIALER